MKTSRWLTVLWIAVGVLCQVADLPAQVPPAPVPPNAANGPTPLDPQVPPLPKARPPKTGVGAGSPASPARVGATPWAPVGAAAEADLRRPLAPPSSGLSPFAAPPASAEPRAALPAAASAGLGPVPSALPARPYSGYRPSSPISPYLNMYRFNPGVGVDNYNLYVRPALEQQSLNRQLESQVQGLQMANWLQTAAGAQPGAPSGTPGGFWQGAAQTPTAASYMNLQPYYPGSGATRGAAPRPRP